MATCLFVKSVFPATANDIQNSFPSSSSNSRLYSESNLETENLCLFTEPPTKKQRLLDSTDVDQPLSKLFNECRDTIMPVISFLPPDMLLKLLVANKNFKALVEKSNINLKIHSSIDLRDLSSKFPNLSYLSIYGYDRKQRKAVTLSEENWQTLVHFPSLTKLEFVFYNFTRDECYPLLIKSLKLNKSVKFFPALKEVRLDYGGSFNLPKDLMHLICSAPLVEKLYIETRDNMLENICLELLRNKSAFTSFTLYAEQYIFTKNDWEIIASLPHLTHFAGCFKGGQTTSLEDLKPIKNCHNLRSLQLLNFFDIFSSQEHIKILSEIKTLRKIDLGYMNNKIYKVVGKNILLDILSLNHIEKIKLNIGEVTIKKRKGPIFNKKISQRGWIIKKMISEYKSKYLTLRRKDHY